MQGVHARFIREGDLLDAVVLLPLSGMDAGTYMARIGLRYLTIPIIAVGIRYAAAQAVRGAMVRQERSMSTEGAKCDGSECDCRLGRSVSAEGAKNQSMRRPKVFEWG
jgi:hypothetical protein